MSFVPKTAMILAAGLGQRMRPITERIPKPLIEVAGRRLIDRAVDRLVAAGVTRIIVNAHHLADQIEAWARSRRDVAITVSDERDELLDTGGGVARALAMLGREPFFVMNSDGFWIESGTPALERLAGAWGQVRMDCLLLLGDPRQATGHGGRSDFLMDEGGRLKRSAGSAEGLVYIGAFIAAPRIFTNLPAKRFSMNVLWDRAIAGGRLHGLCHDGAWLHVGTPEAIDEAERRLASLS